MRPSSALALSVLLALPGLARAADPAELGVIAAEIEAGEKALRASAGDSGSNSGSGSGSGSGSQSRQRELDRKIEGNRKAVLKKHKISERDYSKQSIKLGRDRLEVKEAARKSRAAELAAEAEKARQKPADKDVVQVVRGFDANRPVVVEEVQTGEIPVERGGDTDEGEGVTLYDSDSTPEAAAEPEGSPSEADAPAAFFEE